MYVVVRRYVSISRERNVNIKDVGIVLSTLLPRRDMLHTSLSSPRGAGEARAVFFSLADDAEGADSWLAR